MERERRYARIDDDQAVEPAVEIRDEQAPKIRGLAAAYGKWSLDLGGFREIIEPGAFDKVLSRKKLDVVALFDHEGQPLGRTTSGTLRLSTDERGLHYEVDPPDTQLGRDVQTLIRRKDLFGSSFAFTVDPKGEAWSDDGKSTTRTIREFSGLFDVSVVTHAAYGSATSVAVRSLDAWKAARGLVHTEDGRGLLINLDYDRTYTAAPGLWRSFVVDALARGNRVCCITRREDTEENREELRLAFGDLDLAAVVLCGPNVQKRSAAAAAGLEVDIWIDDSPEKIPAAEERSATRVRVSGLAGARAAAAAAVARARAHEFPG